MFDEGGTLSFLLFHIAIHLVFVVRRWKFCVTFYHESAVLRKTFAILREQSEAIKINRSDKKYPLCRIQSPTSLQCCYLLHNCNQIKIQYIKCARSCNDNTTLRAGVSIVDKIKYKKESS